MKLTVEHEWAMLCLPYDGRWKSEPQLIGLTELGSRTAGIYMALSEEGYCDRRLVPILVGLADTGEFLRCFRALQRSRDRFIKAVAMQRIAARAAKKGVSS